MFTFVGSKGRNELSLTSFAVILGLAGIFLSPRTPPARQCWLVYNTLLMPCLLCNLYRKTRRIQGGVPKSLKHLDIYLYPQEQSSIIIMGG